MVPTEKGRAVPHVLHTFRMTNTTRNFILTTIAFWFCDAFRYVCFILCVVFDSSRYGNGIAFETICFFRALLWYQTIPAATKAA